MRGQRRIAADEGRASVVFPGRRVAAIATRQSGVIGRRQLLEAGVHRRTIDRWVEAGRLLRIHRGVYAVGHAALSRRSRSVAALLAVGPDAVLSHRWAASLWGMLPWQDVDGFDVEPEVTVAHRSLKWRADIVTHTTCTSTPGDVLRRDGLPITSPLRTLRDMSLHDELDRAIAEAQVLRLVTRAQLEAAGGRLRDAVADGRAAPTRSELERAMLRLVARAGLPQPAANARVAGVEVDFLWARERLVVETDGWGAHGHRAAFERDRARDAALQVLGHSVLRFTWRQLQTEPMLVAARLAGVLAARRAAVPG
jgi:very-short-patch-repair endonuclease